MFWIELSDLEVSLHACKPVFEECEISPLNAEGLILSEPLKKESDEIKQESFRARSRVMDASLTHLRTDLDSNSFTVESFFEEVNQKKASFVEKLWETRDQKVNVIEFTRYFIQHLSDNNKLYLLDLGTWVSRFVENVCLEHEYFKEKDCPLYSSFRDYLFAYFGISGIIYWHTAYHIGGNNKLIFSMDVDIESELPREEKLEGRLWYDIESLARRWKDYKLQTSDIIHLLEIGELEACFNWRAAGYAENCFTFNTGFINSVTPLAKFRKLTPEVHQGHRITEVIHAYELVSGNSQLEDIAALDKHCVREIFATGKTKQPFAGLNGFQLDASSFHGLLTEIDANQLLVTSREVRRYEQLLKAEPSNDTTLSFGAWKAFGVLIELLIDTENYDVDADIKAAIRAKFPKERGLSNRSLDDFFATARRHLSK